MVPQTLQVEGEERRRQLRLRNWFTVLWLLLFSYTSQALAFGPLGILTASGAVRLLIFLGAFAMFLGGFILFDFVMERVYPGGSIKGEGILKRGRQI